MDGGEKEVEREIGIREDLSVLMSPPVARLYRGKIESNKRCKFGREEPIMVVSSA